jgi:PilZ domain-containing protein
MRFNTAETKVMLTKVEPPAILVLVMDPKQNASVSSTSAALAEKRHEKRLHLAVPVKVFPDVASFESHNCCTYEISTSGARLVAPPGIKSVGQTIWLQRQNRRAKYKVMWIGENGSSLQGQVGVECLEPANVIWEPEIKARIMRS